MLNICTAFAKVAACYHVLCSASLLEQLSYVSLSLYDSLPSSSSDICKDLHHALDTAIGSLCTLGGLYEQWEMCWIEEKHRLDEDKEKVLLLLRQVLGIGIVGDLVEIADSAIAIYFFSFLCVGESSQFFFSTHSVGSQG
jgi:hypothetical protein